MLFFIRSTLNLNYYNIILKILLDPVLYETLFHFLYFLHLQSSISQVGLSRRCFWNNFGDQICFTYPRNLAQSQMFYSTWIYSADIVETLRPTDPVKICAEKLQSECKVYDFNLNATLTTANNLQLTLDQYRQNFAPSWKVFFQALCPSWKTAETVHRNADIIS